MTRKTRSRQKPRRRQRKSRAGLLPAAFGGELGRSKRHATQPLGWRHFVAGITVGAVLGIATAILPDWSALGRPGWADKVIAAPNPESRELSTGARVQIESPPVIEPAPRQAATAVQYAAAPQPASAAKTAPAPQPDSGKAAESPATKLAVQTPPAQDQQVAAAPQEAAIVDVYQSGSAADATWLRNSVAFAVPRGRPVIAIVLDDVGVNKAQAEQAIKLPPEITLSFMTYAEGVDEMAARARAKGHELMVHVPMEPLGGENDPGPKALKVALSDAEILERLRWGLERFDGYVGINNHMGSRFTQDERGMRLVMQELRRRDLLFLDSRTIGASVGDRVADEAGIVHLSRDVFLDDVMSSSAVAQQLAVAERVARATGHAIAIGHPHAATIAAIKAWLPQAKARGFIIAPLSVIAKRRTGDTG